MNYPYSISPYKLSDLKVKSAIPAALSAENSGVAKYVLSKLESLFCKYLLLIAKGIASNHSDPEHLWKQYGMGYTMNTFRKAVKAAMKKDTSYMVKITAFVLNVRNGVGVTHPITTTVRKGEIYTIVDESNGWGKLKSGAGWINLKYTKKL